MQRNQSELNDETMKESLLFCISSGPDCVSRLSER